MKCRSTHAIFVTVIALTVSACSLTSKNTDRVPTPIENSVQSTALLYFLENSNPHTGLVRDVAENFRPTSDTNRVASIAATGFGLAVVVHAATRGLVTEEFAQDYARKVLTFTRDNVLRRKGWFVHFVDWETGERMWDSEYSTIDTALFLAGALYAAAIYPNTDIAKIAHQLYADTDFIDSMTNGGALPNKRTLSMAYFDGSGYTAAQWNMYAEEIILLVLGLGHPHHPLPPEVWVAWQRGVKTLGESNERAMGVDQALFVHQYSQLYLDLRHFKDVFSNYHENGKRVSQFHRDLANEKAASETLRSGFWGFSAGDAPGDHYRVATGLNHSTTACIGCAAASAMYMPKEVLADIENWKNGPYGPQVWGKYGLVDSVDLDQKWFSNRVFGITVGPEYLSMANLDESTSIWKDFMRIPEIQAGLKRAGLKIGWPLAESAPPNGETPISPAPASANKQYFRSHPTEPETHPASEISHQSSLQTD